jgi:hypothetical protein
MAGLRRAQRYLMHRTLRDVCVLFMVFKLTGSWQMSFA